MCIFISPGAGVQIAYSECKIAQLHVYLLNQHHYEENFKPLRIIVVFSVLTRVFQVGPGEEIVVKGSPEVKALVSHLSRWSHHQIPVR